MVGTRYHGIAPRTTHLVVGYISCLKYYYFYRRISLYTEVELFALKLSYITFLFFIIAADIKDKTLQKSIFVDIDMDLFIMPMILSNNQIGNYYRQE